MSQIAEVEGVTLVLHDARVAHADRHPVGAALLHLEGEGFDFAAFFQAGVHDGELVA